MKTSKAFVLTLASVSIIVFIAIALKFFGKFDMGDMTANLVFIVLGVGLSFEGHVWKLFSKEGRSDLSIPKILTLVTSKTIIIVGILGLIGINSPILDAFKGWVSIVAINVIVMEMFYIE